VDFCFDIGGHVFKVSYRGMWTRRAWLAAAMARKGIRVSVITDEVAASEAGAFTFCRQYGVQRIELRNVPGSKRGYWDLPPAEMRAFAGRCRAEGVSISFIDSGLLAAPLPGTAPVKTPGPAEAARYERRMEDLDRVLELAHAVGADKIRCFSFRRVAEPRALFDRIAEQILPMVERAGRAGVQLVLENESSCNVATTAELVEFAGRIQSKWFGLNWDPGNAAHQETAYPDAYRLLPIARLANVQVKGKGILPGGPDPVDWRAILAALRKDGYTGDVGLETHTADRYTDSHAAVQALLLYSR
jgi:sugar phosphate isomerase/epimerase